MNTLHTQWYRKDIQAATQFKVVAESCSACGANTKILYNSPLICGLFGGTETINQSHYLGLYVCDIAMYIINLI